MSTGQPRILFIFPGPLMEMRTKHFEGLSKHFTGCILTSSHNPDFIAAKTVGSFTWKCIKFKRSRKGLFNIYFLLYAIIFCFKKLFSNEKYDLIVTYDPLKTGIMGMICSIILNTKFAPEVNGVYTSPAQYLDDAERVLTKLKKFFYPKIEKMVLSRAQGIKLLFPTQLAPFKKTVQGKIIRWFSNNVNIGPFLLLDNTSEKDEILFAGFPFKLKGVDILIEAFKSIADKYPSWQLKILGWFENPEELHKAIGDHPQIKHHLPVFPPEMPKQIAQCSIFVLPSRSEAMGRILVETMAAGKPRIGANVDGIPTVIQDGVDGLLFERENPADLANKMELLISSPELRKKLGMAGRKRAQTEFNGDVYFNNLIKFYNELLKNNNL